MDMPKYLCLMLIVIVGVCHANPKYGAVFKGGYGPGYVQEHYVSIYLFMILAFKYEEAYNEM